MSRYISAGPLMVVVEFAAHGQLLRYLRSRRTQNYDNMNEYNLDIAFAERLRIAIDVAKGMAHLAKMKASWWSDEYDFLFKCCYLTKQDEWCQNWLLLIEEAKCDREEVKK